MTDMTKEQFEKVKYGDILTYASNEGTVLVKVKSKYSFNYGGRIRADVISENMSFLDCDAPYSCFEICNIK